MSHCPTILHQCRDSWNICDMWTTFPWAPLSTKYIHCHTTCLRLSQSQLPKASTHWSWFHLWDLVPPKSPLPLTCQVFRQVWEHVGPSYQSHSLGCESKSRSVDFSVCPPVATGEICRAASAGCGWGNWGIRMTEGSQWTNDSGLLIFCSDLDL